MRTERIFANRYWNDTGIALVKGKRYRLSVRPGEGEPLCDKGFKARSIEGEDWGLLHRVASVVRAKRMDGEKWFALIGTVNREHPWRIVDGAIVSAPAGGPLLCFFNDVQVEAFYHNNSGWVVLDVEAM